MNKAFIFLALALSAGAHAQTNSTEFERVQREYQAASKAALEPITRRYADNLQQLLKRATAGGDLDTAVKAKELLAQLTQPPPASGVLEGSRWTFPVKNMPRDKQWIEFRADGALALGWSPNPKAWKLLSPGHVSFRPYTDENYLFVIELDPTLTKAKITEGEFKGETMQRMK